VTTTPRHGGASSAARDVANLGLVRPPLVYLISILSGTVIHLVVPLPFLPIALAEPLGVPIVAVAVALFSYSIASSGQPALPCPAESPPPPSCAQARIASAGTLPGVLTVSTRYRDLDQQRAAAGYTRRVGDANPLGRNTERRAVPRTEIRCAVLGLQSVRPPLAVSHPGNAWND